MRRSFTPTLIFLGFWLLLLLTQRSKPFNDPGSFWHVVVGERILTQGLPDTDEYSFTFHGQHWVPQQWLAECGMALLHRVGGFDSLLVAMSGLLSAVFTFLSLRSMRSGMPWPGALAFGCFCLFACSFHFYCRPHLITIALMAWTFSLLTEVENGTSPRKLIWLLPVCILWTNLHGGVLAGVFTLGLAVAGWTLVGRLNRRTFIGLSALTVGCLLTPLINPFGLDLMRIWYGIMSSSVLKEIVPEHTPLSLSRSGDRLVLAFALCYLLALAGLRTFPRVTWLIPAVWLFLTIQSIRQGPIFAVLAGLAVADMWPHTRWAGAFEMRRLRLSNPILGPAFVILAALGIQAANGPVPLVGRGWVQHDERYVPEGLLDELQSYADSHPEGTPIFNDSLYGGFLIYHTPRLRVFIDDRCELYGDEFLREYAEVMGLHPERIDGWAERYGFDLALVEPRTPADAYMSGSGSWAEIAREPGGVLYAYEASASETSFSTAASSFFGSGIPR